MSVLLLDTHTLIWVTEDPSRLSSTAAAAIADPANKCCVSSASLWELAIKVSTGKFTMPSGYEAGVNLALSTANATEYPLAVRHYARVAVLPFYGHRDPFDRMIAAQALVDTLTLVSADVAFDQYGVSRLW